jgi:hypothetical protein
MAEFNQAPQAERPENFTGYSRGIDATPNTALGTLFGTLGETLQNSALAADRLTQEKIRDEIYEDVDAIEDNLYGDAGLDDATLFSRAPNKQPLPAQLASAGENLDRLQAAYERGALRESHYWGRLNAMVKQLRHKYPGYRTEIDNMVSAVTGARPANALRNALFNEWDAQASQTDPLSKLALEMANEGTLPLDFDARMNSENPYNHTSLMMIRATKNAEVWERNRRTAALTELAANDQLTTKEATRMFRIEANQSVRTTLGDMTTSLGTQFRNLSGQINTMQMNVAAGEPGSEEMVTKLAGSLGELRAAMTDLLNNEFLKSWDGDPSRSYVNFIDEDTKKKIIDEALAPINMLEESLYNQNFGMTKAITNWSTALQNDANRMLMEQVPILRTFKSAQDAMGPDGFSFFLSLNPELQNGLAKTILDYHKARAASDPTFSVSESFEEAEALEVESEFYDGVVKQWTNMVTEMSTGNVPLEVVQKNVDFMFGPNAGRVMSQLDDASRYQYFSRVASPIVTEQMRKLRDMGDVESWENYQTWVTQSFMVLFQSKVVTMQNASQSLFVPGMSVVWDEKNAMFRLNSGSPVDFAIPGMPLSGLDNMNVNGQLSELNSAIRVVKPILEDAGGEVGPEIYELLRQMGFDPENQTDFVGMLMAAVAGMMDAEAEAEELANPEEESTED